MHYDSLAGEGSYTNTQGTFNMLFFSCFPGIDASKSESKIYLLGVMVGAFNYVTEEKSPG